MLTSIGKKKSRTKAEVLWESHAPRGTVPGALQVLDCLLSHQGRPPEIVHFSSFILSTVYKGKRVLTKYVVHGTT